MEKRNWKRESDQNRVVERTAFCSDSPRNPIAIGSNRIIAFGKDNGFGDWNFSGRHSQGSRQGPASCWRRNPSADHDARPVFRPRPRSPSQEGLHHPRSQCFSSHRYLLFPFLNFLFSFFPFFKPNFHSPGLIVGILANISDTETSIRLFSLIMNSVIGFLNLFSWADIWIVKFVQGVVQFSRGVFLPVPATSYHIISSDRYCYCFLFLEFLVICFNHVLWLHYLVFFLTPLTQSGFSLAPVSSSTVLFCLDMCFSLFGYEARTSFENLFTEKRIPLYFQ